MAKDYLLGIDIQAKSGCLIGDGEEGYINAMLPTREQGGPYDVITKIVETANLL